MNKLAYQEKLRNQADAEKARIEALSTAVKQTKELNWTTTPNSQYRPFEESFGATRLKEINDFLYSLDATELDNYTSLSDPLLSICQKFLDWKVEAGSARLWHELFITHDNTVDVIRKAWEQVKKEHDIIAEARQVQKNHLNKTLEEQPNLASEDPAMWISLCAFNEFESLQSFGYPLPFDSVFGEYAPQPFNYGKPQLDVTNGDK